jgi:hypothetical protein
MVHKRRCTLIKEYEKNLFFKERRFIDGEIWMKNVLAPYIYYFTDRGSG